MVEETFNRKKPDSGNFILPLEDGREVGVRIIPASDWESISVSIEGLVHPKLDNEGWRPPFYCGEETKDPRLMPAALELFENLKQVAIETKVPVAFDKIDHSGQNTMRSVITPRDIAAAKGQTEQLYRAMVTQCATLLEKCETAMNQAIRQPLPDTTVPGATINDVVRTKRDEAKYIKSARSITDTKPSFN